MEVWGWLAAIRRDLEERARAAPLERTKHLEEFDEELAGSSGDFEAAVRLLHSYTMPIAFQGMSGADIRHVRTEFEAKFQSGYHRMDRITGIGQGRRIPKTVKEAAMYAAEDVVRLLRFDKSKPDDLPSWRDDLLAPTSPVFAFDQELETARRDQIAKAIREEDSGCAHALVRESLLESAAYWLWLAYSLAAPPVGDTVVQGTPDGLPQDIEAWRARVAAALGHEDVKKVLTASSASRSDPDKERGGPRAAAAIVVEIITEARVSASTVESLLRNADKRRRDQSGQPT